MKDQIRLIVKNLEYFIPDSLIENVVVPYLFKYVWEKQLEITERGSLISSFLSPDGCRLIYSTGKRVKIVDTVTGRLLNTINETTHASFLSSNFDGSVIVCASDSIRVYDSISGELINRLESGHVRAIRMSDDGGKVVFCTTVGTVGVWDFNRLQTSWLSRLNRQLVRFAHIIPDMSQIICVTQFYQLYETETAKLVTDTRLNKALATIVDSRSFCVSNYECSKIVVANENKINIWNVHTLKWYATIENTDKVETVSISLDESRVACNSQNTVRVWMRKIDDCLDVQ